MERLVTFRWVIDSFLLPVGTFHCVFRQKHRQFEQKHVCVSPQRSRGEDADRLLENTFSIQVKQQISNNLLQPWKPLTESYFFFLFHLEILFFFVEFRRRMNENFAEEAALDWLVFTQGVRVHFTWLLLFALETIHGGDQPLQRLQVAAAPRGFAAAGPLVCRADKDDKCHETASRSTLFF